MLHPTKYLVRLDSYQDSRPEDVITLSQETDGQKLQIRMPADVARVIHGMLGLALDADVAPRAFEIIDVNGLKNVHEVRPT